ncbi:DUF3017 domain-containing protein [Arthrobacter castelli]|uniref:DUF3017 domain-containing protein n=1 Tax=Arthrobacter castelli TaxID=271431 RepID=UPI000421075F|nr:DUF3017 domain-containing protein [Arthrobacter castelli]
MSEPHEPAPGRGRAGTGQGLLLRRWRFIWFALAALILAMVLAVTASFRVTGFVLAALLMILAVLRGTGREEGMLFAARSRAFDAVVLAGCAVGLVLFSVIAPA